jgi:hypothetical protein
MPFKSNDSLDDELILDGTNGFTTGQVSATRPDNIANTSYAQGLNLDYDDFGNLVTRPGTVPFKSPSDINKLWEEILTNWNSYNAYWGSSLSPNADVVSGFFFDTAAAERLVVAVTQPATSNQLYYSDQVGGEAVYTAIAGSSFSDSAKYIYFAQLNDRLFYSDGFNSLKYITAANANQSIAAGKISRIDVINEGSNHSQLPTITIAAPPSGTTATATAVVSGDGNLVAIIITKPGSGYTAGSNPTVTISQQNGSHAVAYVSLGPPPVPIYLTTHTQRLFCASADTNISPSGRPSNSNFPDTLYFSDILDGETWDPAGSVRVGGDGDPITGLYSWFANKLLVFKERSIWAVDADPQADPADWVISLISGNVGCVSHRSIAAVGADVLFLARDGVRSLAQIQAGTQTDVGLPLSAPIGDIMSQIDRQKYQYCDAVYWNNRYLLAVPKNLDQVQNSEYNILLENGNELISEGGANLVTNIMHNNTVYVYHLLAKAWLGEWNNWQVTDFIPTSFSSRGPVLMFSGDISNLANASSQIYIFNDYIPETRFEPSYISNFRDAGQPYSTAVVTKAFNFNEPMVDKIGYNVQFSTDNPYSNWEPEISFSYSLNMSNVFSSLDTKVSIPVQSFKYQKAYTLISKGRWNSIQFKQICTDGRMMVQSVIATAFPQTIKVKQ